jgi:hypothetical protein
LGYKDKCVKVKLSDDKWFGYPLLDAKGEPLQLDEDDPEYEDHSDDDNDDDKEDGNVKIDTELLYVKREV